VKLIEGKNPDALKDIESNSVDSIVTDPPAGIAFMGKEWDKDKGGKQHWIEWMTNVAKECIRAMKPGGHALVWAIPRTSHWTGDAWENAGWEMRDKIYHCFGSGFPKNMDIHKKDNRCPEGLGTALKPAVEEWWLLRKPIAEKTIAENVLKHGTAGLNINDCRVEVDPDDVNYFKTSDDVIKSSNIIKVPNQIKRGGVIHDGSSEVLEVFPYSKSGGGVKHPKKSNIYGGNSLLNSKTKGDGGICDPSEGSAARFFYCAKSHSSERNMGMKDFVKKQYSHDGRNKPIENAYQRNNSESENFHPTVKPLELMRYLVRLITPPGGIVLDPFMGSGTTGMAAAMHNFGFIGIDMNKEYIDIARARIKKAGEQIRMF
jgi:site-specific DNA-methyltransferase (adenine-specific)